MYIADIVARNYKLAFDRGIYIRTIMSKSSNVKARERRVFGWKITQWIVSIRRELFDCRLLKLDYTLSLSNVTTELAPMIEHFPGHLFFVQDQLPLSHIHSLHLTLITSPDLYHSFWCKHGHSSRSIHLPLLLINPSVSKDYSYCTILVVIKSSKKTNGNFE